MIYDIIVIGFNMMELMIDIDCMFKLGEIVSVLSFYMVFGGKGVN